jgi:hypothetical protein
MGANLRQLAVQGPGSQGLNSELSPFQQSIEFALKADNCVIDRVGRLASREAFADYSLEHDIEMTVSEQFDVVRILTMEPEGLPNQIPIVPEKADIYAEAKYMEGKYSNYGISKRDGAVFSIGKYGVGRYGTDRYNLDSRNEDSEPNLTFCLIGIGRLGLGETKYSRYGIARYGAALYGGLTVEYTAFDRYIGAVLEGDRIRAIPQIRTSHGVRNAQLVPFKSAVYIFSKGDGVQVYDGGVPYKLSAHPNFSPPRDDTGIIANEIDGDIAIAAYGRLWVSGVNNDYDTIYYSDLLVPHQWYDGTTDESGQPADPQNTAGIIDVREYWPSGNDRIQGLAAHNGFLIVFGRHSILIYSGAQGDPAGENGLQLQDAIRNVGLVNQDAMCNIGTDHLFVDSLGVRSLGRVIQEKSAPIAEPSLNVATVIREAIERSRDLVRLLHLPSKSKALCLFPNTQEAYCFQLGQPSATGGLRVTQWTGCDFWDSATLRTDYVDRELLGARNDRGVTLYDGYTQPFKYTMSYESSVLLSGESLMQSMIPKSLVFSYHSEQEMPFYARWGFGSNEMEYMAKSQKARGSTEFKTSKVNTAGSGEMLRVGFDCQIHGNHFAMQQISVNAVVGRVIV